MTRHTTRNIARIALGIALVAGCASIETDDYAHAQPLEDVIKPTYDAGTWHNVSGNVPACPTEDSCALVLDEYGHWHVVPVTP